MSAPQNSLVDAQPQSSYPSLSQALPFAQIYARCGNPAAVLGTQSIPGESERLNCLGFETSKCFAELLSRKTPPHVRTFIEQTIRKDARMILHEYGTARKLTVCVMVIHQSGAPGAEVFVSEATVGGRVFPQAAALTKNESKRKAAEYAIAVLLDDGLITADSVSSLP